MTDSVISTKALPKVLFRIIPTEKVRVRELDGVIQIMPIKEPFDCTIGLRGMLAGCSEMSVDKFLARKHLDKEINIHAFG